MDDSQIEQIARTLAGTFLDRAELIMRNPYLGLPVLDALIEQQPEAIQKAVRRRAYRIVERDDRFRLASSAHRLVVVW